VRVRSAFFFMLGHSYSAPQTARIVRLKGANRSVIYLMVIAAACYFPWRITTFNPDALILSLALYAAAMFGLVTILLHAFMTWRMIEREAPLPDATVDVFIPTYNEPVEMLRRTVLAARNMHYPHKAGCSMSRPVTTLVSFVIVAACVSAAARADALVLSGAEHGVSSSYAFIGTIIPLPGNARGIRIRRAPLGRLPCL